MRVAEKLPMKVQMGPMRYAQIYLWGTFLLFLTGGLVAEVDTLWMLISFVIAAYGLFYVGYRLGVRTSRFRCFSSAVMPVAQVRRAKWLVIIGTAYFAVFGINMLLDFGYRSPLEVIAGILNPGGSYKAKFDVYEARLEAGYVNPLTQLLILTSIVYAAFIPVLVCYWRSLSRRVRVAAILSLGIYAVAFLAIGTMKGLGDILLLVMAGLAVLVGSGASSIPASQKRMVIAVGLVFAAGAAVYMGVNQVSRAAEFGITESVILGNVGDTLVAKVFGEKFAFGLYSVLAYPSHGYAGLAYNLDQPFVFSHGAGLSQALESYKLQYLGGNQNFWLTYPARTEMATGWPAGQFWATAFPWWASDLTFPGAALTMGVLGFVLARVWLYAIRTGRILPLTIFGQLVVCIAFLPANNQVLMQRQGLWMVLGIVGLWVLGRLTRGRA